MLNLGALLKRSPLLYTINSEFKARITKYKYRDMQEYYTRIAEKQGITYSEEKLPLHIRQRLEQRGIHRVPMPKGQLRIFYVGTVYEQDSSGILQGLQKFGEVITFKDYNGDYGQVYPWGLSGKIRSTSDKNSPELINQIQEALIAGPIHVVLGQMWASTMQPSALQYLRDMGLLVVNIAMDDRHAFRGKRYKGQRTGPVGLIHSIDLAATAAPECCLWYLAEGCPAIYMPEGSDPDLFHPSSQPKRYDVCFVGARYGIREKIVKAIEKSGVHVECYGSGWPKGRIPTEEVPTLFACSKIVLGVGAIGYCKDFYALKMRDFDGPMSGSLYLTHHNPDLEDLFEIGEEIETFHNIEECVEKFHYYLKHPAEREEIAQAGRRRAEKEHTWENRFTDLFGVLGLLVNTKP